MTESSAPQKQFGISKLYLKDASFESPDAPHSFDFGQWNPKVDLNMTNSNAHIRDNLYEAVLSVTAKIMQGEKNTCLVEVHYGGLFEITGFGEDELKYLLGSQAMTILFPYVRETISDLTVRGGFPPMVMAPVNFDALFQQHMQKQQAGGETETA